MANQPGLIVAFYMHALMHMLLHSVSHKTTLQVNGFTQQKNRVANEIGVFVILCFGIHTRMSHEMPVIIIINLISG